MKIYLDSDDIATCYAFSNESAKTQQACEYGQLDSPKRRVQEIAIDNMIGKLGEFAVKKFLAEHAIEIALDMNIYDYGQYDSCDFNYRGWTCDVKCTKSFGKHFLIEWNKLQFRADLNELPHYFVMTRLVDNSFLSNKKESLPSSICVELVGYCDIRALHENNKNISIIDRGHFIPGTTTPLTAKSFCIPFKNLDKDWETFVKILKERTPFELKNQIVTSLAHNSPEFEKTLPTTTNKGPKYSLLLSGDEYENISSEELKTLIEDGIKLFIFVNSSHVTTTKTHFRKLNRNQCSIHEIQTSPPALKIIDGVCDENQLNCLTKLAELSSFNLEQYRVEHARQSPAIIVKASAGTGKTSVMIDRIVFLLATDESLEPSDIGVITFTNKATSSMLEKLQNRLMELYQVTGKQRWYLLLEKLTELQLSTIDSFFHRLIETEGSTLGFGKNAQLRSFTHEKQKLIRQIIDERFIKNPSDSLLKSNHLTIARYVKVIMLLWDKLHSQGFFREDIYAADFGVSSNSKESDDINTNLHELIVEAEKRYQIIKQENNAYAIDDIKSEVNALSLSETKQLRCKKLRYLFVDEFQDTDNGQIQCLVWLQQLMKCQLFVVGDVKQSIYRFRGADESAFDELIRRLKLENKHSVSDISTFVLSKNYRTVAPIIDQLNPIFANWATEDNNLITWDTNAISAQTGDGKLLYERTDVSSRDFAKSAIDILTEHWHDMSHVCVLTRRNSEVEKFSSWCRQANIQHYAKLNGGFFQSKPVIDFTSILGSILYPKDTKILWNALSTPYASKRPKLEQLLCFNGDEEKICSYLQSVLNRNKWGLLQKQAKYQQFFSWLENLLTQLDPVGNWTAMLKSQAKTTEAIDYQVDFYRLNLNKLLRVLYENFSGEYATLLNVYEFLTNKILTNKEEDLIYPPLSHQNSQPLIEIMTVHQAKGLEFETVFMPFLHEPFITELTYPDVINTILLRENCQLKVGWRIDKYSNDFFNQYNGIETEAVRRDEARLLYVALTRAKKNLLLILPEKVRQNSWSEYLLETLVKNDE